MYFEFLRKSLLESLGHSINLFDKSDYYLKAKNQPLAYDLLDIEKKPSKKNFRDSLFESFQFVGNTIRFASEEYVKKSKK
jgi:hypothetical protein